MKSFVFSAILLCLALSFVFCDDKGQAKKVGDPIYHLEAAAGGRNLRNFQGGYNAGIGTKVWEKKDKSLEMGVMYGQNFARVQGHTYKLKPSVGVGATFRWGKKK